MRILLSLVGCSSIDLSSSLDKLRKTGLAPIGGGNIGDNPHVIVVSKPEDTDPVIAFLKKLSINAESGMTANPRHPAMVSANLREIKTPAI